MAPRRGDREFEIGAEIGPSFLERRCPEAARDLLGCLLIHRTEEGITGGIITETEAYLGVEDPACHLSSGRTARTEPFFSGPGTVYVFKIYHYSNANLITEIDGYPECVLIRAIEPTHGTELMKSRREKKDLTQLTTGPGRLTQALGVRKEDINDTNVGDELEVYQTDVDVQQVERGPRIGVTSAEDWPLRYCVKDSPFLSKPLNGNHAPGGPNLSNFYKKIKPVRGTV